MACANDHCNAIDTLYMLVEGPHPAHPLETKYAHSNYQRSNLIDNALYVTRAKGTNIVPLVWFW